MIFSTLYHELVCHVEHFSVELDTFTSTYDMEKEFQQIVFLYKFSCCSSLIIHCILY